MNVERDARKLSLKKRIDSIKRIEKLCAEILENLDKEMQVIEDEEADEFEIRWSQFLASRREQQLNGEIP